MNIACLAVPEKILPGLLKVKDAFEHLKTVDIQTNGYEGDHFATAFVLCEALANVYDKDVRMAGGYFGSTPHFWLVSTVDGKIFDILPHGFCGGVIVADPSGGMTSKLYKEELRGVRPKHFDLTFGHCVNRIVEALTRYENNHPQGG